MNIATLLLISHESSYFHASPPLPPGAPTPGPPSPWRRGGAPSPEAAGRHGAGPAGPRAAGSCGGGGLATDAGGHGVDPKSSSCRSIFHNKNHPAIGDPPFVEVPANGGKFGKNT